MKSNLRKITIMLCLFLILLMTTQCKKQDKAEKEDKLADLSSCEQCHREIYAEWQASMHAKAWTDVMSLSEKAALEKHEGEAGYLSCLPSSISGSLQPQEKVFKVSECSICHAPLPIQITGIGVFPSLRDENKEEGITCIACHQDYDGAQRGQFDVQAPHKTVKDKRYTSVELCFTCHGTCPLGKQTQVEEWKESSYSKKGITCQDCHMPKIDRRIAERGGSGDLPVRKSGRHTWKGAHDEEMLRSAASIKVTIDKGKVIVKIINNGAGHSIPGAGGRAVIADTSILKKGGVEVLHKQEIFNTVNKNRIKADEIRILKYDLPITHGEVKVKLLYKLFSNLLDDQAVVMANAETTF